MAISDVQVSQSEEPVHRHSGILSKHTCAFAYSFPDVAGEARVCHGLALGVEENVQPTFLLDKDALQQSWGSVSRAVGGRETPAGGGRTCRQVVPESLLKAEEKATGRQGKATSSLAPTGVPLCSLQ